MPRPAISLATVFVVAVAAAVATVASGWTPFATQHIPAHVITVLMTRTHCNRCRLFNGLRRSSSSYNPSHAVNLGGCVKGGPASITMSV
jgi:hypothetical protein